jgi:hypothetical protein
MAVTIFDPFLYYPALLKGFGPARGLPARLVRCPHTTCGVTARTGFPGARPMRPRARVGGRVQFGMADKGCSDECVAVGRDLGRADLGHNRDDAPVVAGLSAHADGHDARELRLS